MVLFLDKTNRILDFLCLLMTWSTNQQTSVCKISNCRFAVYILLLAIYRNIDAIMRHTLFTTIFWYIPLLEIYRLWCEPFYCYFRLRLATCCQGCWTKMLYVSPLMSCVKVVISVMFFKLSLYQQSLNTCMYLHVYLICHHFVFQEKNIGEEAWNEFSLSLIAGISRVWNLDDFFLFIGYVAYRLPIIVYIIYYR